MRRPDPEKERRILDSALALVGDKGLGALSMDAVAKLAGVGVGTVYVYFDGKDALIAALYLDVKRSFSERVYHAVPETLPVRRVFEGMCVAYLRYVSERQAEMVFMTQLRNTATLSEGVREEANRTSAPLHALLERGKVEGILKPLPTPLMVSFLGGVLNEMATFASEGDEDDHLQIVQLAWDALKA